MKAYRGFVIVAACLTALARSAAVPAGDAFRSEYEQSVNGVVYWDTNANGRRDRDETGAAGIRLIGNHRTTVTESSGLYTLKSDEPLLAISLSFPSGNWPPQEAEHCLTEGRRLAAGGWDQLIFLERKDVRGSAQDLCLESMVRERDKSAG